MNLFLIQASPRSTGISTFLRPGTNAGSPSFLHISIVLSLTECLFANSRLDRLTAFGFVVFLAILHLRVHDLRSHDDRQLAQDEVRLADVLACEGVIQIAEGLAFLDATGLEQ